MTKLEWVAQTMFKYAGSLFMEPNGDNKYVMSLGRVALAALLAQSMWQWHVVDRDIVSGMKEALFALMAYNFGSKGLQSVKDIMAGRQPSEPPPPEAPK